MKLFKCLLLISFSIPLFACSFPAEEKVKVILEEGDYYVSSHIQTLPKGSDFTFDLTLDVNKVIEDASYKNYTLSETISNDKRYDKITFHSVNYSTVITLSIKEAVKIAYVADETIKEEYVIKNHERVNTSTDYKHFSKEGYYLVGWQNGDEIVSLGSRVDVKENLTLSAVYKKESEASNFEVRELDSSRISIKKYLGDDDVVVIPIKINDKNVIAIEEEAFINKTMEELILPPTLSSISKNSFKNCDIKSLVFFDNLISVDDDSFTDTSIDDIRINAITDPAYIRSYYGTYAEKVDRLINLKDKDKIILYSGSSTRFGFDSELIDKTFKQYEVMNMGVFAYTQSYPQVEVISSLVKKGDILIVSPEFDAIEEQINLRPILDHSFFMMIESNYDILSYLNISDYANFFSSYKEYQYLRSSMNRYSYQETPYQYDEDGNRVSSPSYNRYGDYVVYRPNNEERKTFGVKRAFYNKTHFPEEYISHFNNCYSLLKEKEAILYYDYSPRMNISLSEDSSPSSIQELGEYLSHNIDMTFLSNIDDSLMDPLYFYATDNHLSSEGVDMRTRRVVNALLDELKI